MQKSKTHWVFKKPDGKMQDEIDLRIKEVLDEAEEDERDLRDWQPMVKLVIDALKWKNERWKWFVDEHHVTTNPVYSAIYQQVYSSVRRRVHAADTAAAATVIAEEKS